ncbi:prosaposin-like [Oppia nitens]|uniref:prosaposin-like n=1 Tax=Oppia nitens TaxID=1686743 RepID=UPI0023DBC3D0|nr:prosaposin-like [Oppia nitens]
MDQILLTSLLLIILSITTKGLNALPQPVDNLSSVDKTCKGCTSLVTFIDKLNTNSSQLLSDALVTMCNDYSSLPGKQTKLTCTHIVNDVLKLFNKVDKNAFCDDISACHNNTININTVETNIADDPTCNFCVTVVTNVKEIISGGPTELEVKFFVEDACHYLGSFENECVSLSDEYIDNMFQYIRQNLNPKKFCKSIGACNTTKAIIESNNQSEKFADISEVINIFPPQTVVQLTPLQSAVENGNNDMECVICKRVVEYVIKQLSDNRTEEEIITALQQVCSLFPVRDRSKCSNFIEQYANELIHILIDEGDPNLACTLLGVCVPRSVWQPMNRSNDVEKEETANTKSSVKWTEIEESISSESTVDKLNNSNSKACFECELLMHFIQREIYDYKNEEQIENFIKNQLCQRLQIVMTKDACDNFVQTYGPMIFQLIAQDVFDPTTVCQKELHLCPNTTISVPTAQSPQQDFQVNNQEKCELCRNLVQQMDTLLENNVFDKEVAKYVEKACHPLKNKAKRVECELMIEAFAPYFLQMIGHLSDADKICRSIDMCYSSEGVHLLGGHKCTFGPTYWCHTIAHAEACKATHFCKNKVWKPIA